jgi:peroxiredoxin
MARVMTDLSSLPPDLPRPVDDGAADHLSGMSLPPVALRSTSGRPVNLVDARGWLVVFVYPRIATPGEPEDMLAEWTTIPGARGCTPQACGFRDNFQQLVDLGVQIYGLSGQSHDEQVAAVKRLGLPYQLLSDEGRVLASALQLPEFTFRSHRFLKRMTLFAHDGVIRGVLYPVFPPNESASRTVAWLRNRPN